MRSLSSTTTKPAQTETISLISVRLCVLSAGALSVTASACCSSEVARGLLEQVIHERTWIARSRKPFFLALKPLHSFIVCFVIGIRTFYKLRSKNSFTEKRQTTTDQLESKAKFLVEVIDLVINCRYQPHLIHQWPGKSPNLLVNHQVFQLLDGNIRAN